MSGRPLVLVCNDDGVDAEGIGALAAALAAGGDLEVVVVAPERAHSGFGHAISLDRPLRVREPRPGWRAVDGTPVDCVYLALMHLLPRRPDLVVSGVNHGYNLGSDVFYSGTVAAAVEGALRGVPALAVSADAHTRDFAPAARFAAAMARAVLARGLPPHALLSINVPIGADGAFRWTRLGRRVYRDQVEVRQDLRGRPYYWIGGPELRAPDAPGCDGEAVQADLVSVTPLHLDLTAGHLLAELAPLVPDGYAPVP